MHYSRTVKPLLLADNGEAPTSASRSASLTLAEATKIWLYVRAHWLCTEMNFGYLCNGYAGGWSLLFPVVYCTDKLPTIVCNVVLLWNSKWEKLQGYMDWPSSLDEFLIVNHSLPATDNLSVTQRNHYVNYVFNRNFSVLLMHCVMAATYCVKWTAADISL